MKWIDTIFAWALAFSGIGHFLAAWVPALRILSGPWTGAAAVAVVAAGLMNAIRAQRHHDALVRWNTLLVTLLVTALCMKALYAFPGNVLHQPAALATAVLLVLEALFALVP